MVLLTLSSSPNNQTSNHSSNNATPPTHLLLLSLCISYAHFYSPCHLRLFYFFLILFSMLVVATTTTTFFPLGFLVRFAFSFSDTYSLLELLPMTLVKLFSWASCSNLDSSRRLDSPSPVWALDYFLFLAPGGCSLGFILIGYFSSRAVSIWANGSVMCWDGPDCGGGGYLKVLHQLAEYWSAE